MKDEYLFIGGLWDGCRICLPDPEMDSCEMPDRESGGLTAYYRQRLVDRDGVEIVVFSPQGTSVIGKLIEGYRKP